VSGDALFWLAVVSCVVAQGAIFRAVLAPHPATAQNEPVPRPRTGAEVAWALIPALGLALVLVLTWRAMHSPGRVERMRLSGPSAEVRAP
jgi:heme/copper-type cytochrome/quinol oxidase subunit 2